MSISPPLPDPSRQGGGPPYVACITTGLGGLGTMLLFRESFSSSYPLSMMKRLHTWMLIPQQGSRVVRGIRGNGDASTRENFPSASFLVRKKNPKPKVQFNIIPPMFHMLPPLNQHRPNPISPPYQPTHLTPLQKQSLCHILLPEYVAIGGGKIPD